MQTKGRNLSIDLQRAQKILTDQLQRSTLEVQVASTLKKTVQITGHYRQYLQGHIQKFFKGVQTSDAHPLWKSSQK